MTWRRDILPPVLAGLMSLAAFLPGIGWGLPSRADDRFLFGDREPWTGRQIIELAGGFEADAGRGADVDANPLDRAGGPVVLNDTDQKRAEIVRRYRLQSHQPDEFINFAAIAGMGSRRDLDPRLYQYGGLWLYPLAGLLGAAHVVGYVELTGDLAFYLDNPDEFGRFYVVARLYSAAWGAVAAAAVFVLVRRLSGSVWAGFCGVAAFSLMPVVVTAAHEAKPHLAGAALALWALVKADDFVRTGRRRDAVFAGLLCGASASMVVSMVVSFALLPVMGVLLRNRRRGGRNDITPTPAEAGETCEMECDAHVAHVAHVGSSLAPSTLVSPASAGAGGRAPTPAEAGETKIIPDDRLRMPRVRVPSVFGSVLLAFACAASLYVVTNPFAVYRGLFDRGLFASNLGNSTAMYGGGDPWAATLNAGRVLGLGLGGWSAGAILIGLSFAVLKVGFRQSTRRLRPLGWLLLTVAAANLAFFVPLAEAKIAEYARFALPVAAAALVGWYGATAALAGRRAAGVLAVVPVMAGLLSGVPYVLNFVADAGAENTRTRAAERVAGLDGLAEVVLSAEPAPYSAPPFDLWVTPATLVGNELSRTPQVRISAAHVADDRLGSWIVAGSLVTPVSWANRPFYVITPGAGSR